MSRPFDQSQRSGTPERKQTTRNYEIARTAVEFAAAVLFLLGSVLFYFEALQFAATTLFLLGSVLFAVRPTVRLALELHLARLPEGDNAAS